MVAQVGEREREWRFEHCHRPSENSTRTAAALGTTRDPALVVSLHIRLALAYLAIHHVSRFVLVSPGIEFLPNALFARQPISVGTATPWPRCPSPYISERQGRGDTTHANGFVGQGV